MSFASSSSIIRSRKFEFRELQFVLLNELGVAISARSCSIKITG